MTAGDEEKADELYQTLVDEGFSSTEVYNRWMMAAMEKGNYEEALQHAEAGLALSDDRAKKEIAFNQAVCYEYLASMRRRWSCSEATRSSMDRTRRRTMRSRFS